MYGETAFTPGPSGGSASSRPRSVVAFPSPVPSLPFTKLGTVALLVMMVASLIPLGLRFLASSRLLSEIADRLARSTISRGVVRGTRRGASLSVTLNPIVVTAKCPKLDFLLAAEVSAKATGPRDVRIEGAPKELAAEFASEHLSERLFRLRPAWLDIGNGRIRLEGEEWPKGGDTSDPDPDPYLDLVAIVAEKLPAALAAAESEVLAASETTGGPYRAMPVADDLRRQMAARHREVAILSWKRRLPMAVQIVLALIAVVFLLLLHR
jgi:hypothetical protein